MDRGRVEVILVPGMVYKRMGLIGLFCIAHIQENVQHAGVEHVNLPKTPQ